jgi:cytochrome P450
MTEQCPVRGLMRKLSSRAGLTDPYPIYDALREAGPMHDAPMFGPVLTRYLDVREVLFDRGLCVSSQAAKPGSARADIAANLPEDLRELPPPLFLQDEPDHKRLRKLVAPYFSQVAIDRLCPTIAAVAHDLCDRLEREHAFDLVDCFAVALPATIIADILGVRAERMDDFRAWSEAVIHELHPLATPEESAAAIAAHRALAQFFRAEISERRTHPRGDLISVLVDALDRRAVSEDEVVSLCVNLLVAGHFTTTDLIASLSYLLLTHPDEREKLAADPGLWPQAVEEALRFEPPTPMLARVHACPAHRHGTDFEPGDSVNVFIASANRDSRLFEAAHRFDISRDDNPHLSFGGGAHYCLGAQLARAEAAIAVRILFERLPGLALEAGGVVWRQTPNFRGLARLAVHHPARAPQRRHPRRRAGARLVTQQGASHAQASRPSQHRRIGARSFRCVQRRRRRRCRPGAGATRSARRGAGDDR